MIIYIAPILAAYTIQVSDIPCISCVINQIELKDWQSGMKVLPLSGRTFAKIEFYDRKWNRLSEVPELTFVEFKKGKKGEYAVFESDQGEIRYLFHPFGLNSVSATGGIRFVVLYDHIKQVEDLILGQEIYTLKRGYHSSGRQYIKATVKSISAGSYGQPIRLTIIDEKGNEGHYDASIDKDDYESIDKHITFTNPRDKHPDIPDAIWDMITEGSLAVGMTPEHARLSWGNPKDTRKSYTGGVLREQWIYQDHYIYFENGKMTAWQEK